MNPKTVLNAVVAAVLFICANAVFAEQETLIQEVGFVGSDANIVSGEFELIESARYSFKLTDLSIENVENTPLEPFEKLTAFVVTDSLEFVKSFDLDTPANLLQLEPGIYQVFIHGQSARTPGKISQFQLDVLQEDVIEPAYVKVGLIPNLSEAYKNYNSINHTYRLQETGKYRLSVTNLSAPSPLETLVVGVFIDADPNSTFNLNASNSTQALSQDFEGEAGEFITLAAQAIPAETVNQGKYEVKLVRVISYGNNDIDEDDNDIVQPIFDDVIDVGDQTNGINTIHKGVFTVSTAGSHTLQFADLKSRTSILEAGPDSFVDSVNFTIESLDTGEMILSRVASEDLIELELDPGNYSLEIYMKSEAEQEEIFGVKIEDTLTNNRIYDHTQVLGKGFLHTEQLPALSEETQLILTDICEEARFNKLALILSNGIEITETVTIEYAANDESYCSKHIIKDIILKTANNLNYQVHIYAVASEITADGKIRPSLYNIQVIDSLSDDLLYENTGALQGDYFTMGYEVDIPSEGTGEFTLYKYNFPEQSPSIRMAIYNSNADDNSKKVTIYSASDSGAGYPFDPIMPGKYFATILAQPSEGKEFAAYGIKMTYTPLPPKIDEQEDGDSSGGGGGNTSMLLLILLTGLWVRKRK